MNWIEHICEPRRLILAWQAPDNTGVRFRWAVGELTPHDGAMSLRYFSGEEFCRLNQGKSVEELSALGYRGYPGFRTKEAVHSNGVLEAFMRRLTPASRADFAEYREHFRLKPESKLSEFAMLGYTEAKLPSDGFSVVTPLEYTDDRFELMLEVAGFRYYAKAIRPIAVGDVATFKPEPSNEHDPNAVMVCVDDQRIGYVNRLQAPAFQRWLNDRHLEALVERVNGHPDRPRVFMFVRITPSSRQVAA
jgi:HIRAN domain